MMPTHFKNKLSLDNHSLCRETILTVQTPTISTRTPLYKSNSSKYLTPRSAQTPIILSPRAGLKTPKQNCLRVVESISDFNDNKELARAITVGTTVKNRIEILDMIIKRREEAKDAEKEFRLKKALPALKLVTEDFVTKARKIKAKEVPKSFVKTLGSIDSLDYIPITSNADLRRPSKLGEMPTFTPMNNTPVTPGSITNANNSKTNRRTSIFGRNSLNLGHEEGNDAPNNNTPLKMPLINLEEVHNEPAGTIVLPNENQTPKNKSEGKKVEDKHDVNGILNNIMRPKLKKIRADINIYKAVDSNNEEKSPIKFLIKETNESEKSLFLSSPRRQFSEGKFKFGHAYKIGKDDLEKDLCQYILMNENSVKSPKTIITLDQSKVTKIKDIELGAKDRVQVLNKQIFGRRASMNVQSLPDEVKETTTTRKVEVSGFC